MISDSLASKSSVTSSAAKTEGAVATAAKAEYALGANEYIGTSLVNGMGGPVTVKIKMDGKRIVAIEVLENKESQGISDNAKKGIPAAIIAKQSTDVDVVTGASMTSRAIMSAVKQALLNVK